MWAATRPLQHRKGGRNAARRVHLVSADNADGALLAIAAGVSHGGTEEHPVDDRQVTGEPLGLLLEDPLALLRAEVVGDPAEDADGARAQRVDAVSDSLGF